MRHVLWVVAVAATLHVACAAPISCDVGGRTETFNDCDALEQEAGCRLLNEPDTPQSEIVDLEGCLLDKCGREPPVDCNTDGHNV